MTKFNKTPIVEIDPTEENIYSGWDSIWGRIRKEITQLNKNKVIIAIECYHGVDEATLQESIIHYLTPEQIVQSIQAFHSNKKIDSLTFPYITNDRVFGYMSRLNMHDFFDPELLQQQKAFLLSIETGVIVVMGPGASLLAADSDILIYADMARWEIQKRMRNKMVCNLGLLNHEEYFEIKYKRGFFVDWRVCDRLKKIIFSKIDFFLDGNQLDNPKMISKETFLRGLDRVVSQPFSLAPFFDPGPWGGQWMKEAFELNKDEINYAWCFNCVPEENSLCLGFGEHIFEMPAVNLVFFKPLELMGTSVYARFGGDFPIRFDYLDTMDGENLSLQVHPVTEYIQEHFGMHYTQDESYYLMDVKDGGSVYLGLKEGIDSNKMMQELMMASETNNGFNANEYVETWPANKHDHFSIPAGTIHCSGKNTMVLEISATPYIFTFKLWDWGRKGLDGRPRPTHLEHGLKNIQWDRCKNWVAGNLIDNIKKIDEGEGWIEEKTGLHESEFIETRRHWFTGKTYHNTNGTVNVLNLVQGKEIIVESPIGDFEPFRVGYAETFIVPASVGPYTICPSEFSGHDTHATIKAFVRSNA